jgi:hypothetical protein
MFICLNGMEDRNGLLMWEKWWPCPIQFKKRKVIYSNADFYTSTKLISSSVNGTAITVEPLSISPQCSGFNKYYSFFLVPMKCPHKQHTTVSDAMSHTVWFYNITWCYIPDDVIIQFDSPDDEHWFAWNMYRS